MIINLIISAKIFTKIITLTPVGNSTAVVVCNLDVFKVDKAKCCMELEPLELLLLPPPANAAG
jgi:hypothetical protein